MKIIAQATLGLPQFLHPDYSSSYPWPPDGYVIIPDIQTVAPPINLAEILVNVYSIVFAVIVVILIANYITNSIKRHRG